MSSKSRTEPLVTIIIPVFNKWELTRQCLAAITATRGDMPAEVVLVDNASSDATSSQMKQFPWVRIIRNETNLGFAKACNQGARLARGRHLLFLNNDTLPLHGWLEPLLREVEHSPEIAAVGSKLLYENGLVQHAGVVFARESRMPYHPYRFLLSDDPLVNRRKEMQAVTAACMLVRGKTFLALKGFDEEYINGWEDLDFCVRLRAMRQKIIYQPRSVLYHLESQTSGRMDQDVQNQQRFFQRWNQWILADEDAFFLSDNFCRIHARQNGRHIPKLVRLQGSRDQEQWALPAGVQVAAAEKDHARASALLEKVDQWPSDAFLRRWAGWVALWLKNKPLAEAHWREALKLEELSDVRHSLVKIAENPSAYLPARPPANGGDYLLHAKVALKGGKYAHAARAFQQALYHGASAQECLDGWASAAAESGDMEHLWDVSMALLIQNRHNQSARQNLIRAGAALNRSVPQL